MNTVYRNQTKPPPGNCQLNLYANVVWSRKHVCQRPVRQTYILIMSVKLARHLGQRLLKRVVEHALQTILCPHGMKACVASSLKHMQHCEGLPSWRFRLLTGA